MHPPIYFITGLSCSLSDHSIMGWSVLCRYSVSGRSCYDHVPAIPSFLQYTLNCVLPIVVTSPLIKTFFLKIPAQNDALNIKGCHGRWRRKECYNPNAIDRSFSVCVPTQAASSQLCKMTNYYASEMHEVGSNWSLTDRLNFTHFGF